MKAPWQLSEEDLREIVQISSGVSLPARCTANIKEDFIVNRQEMKTVDLVAVLCSGVLKVLLALFPLSNDNRTVRCRTVRCTVRIQLSDWLCRSKDD